MKLFKYPTEGIFSNGLIKILIFDIKSILLKKFVFFLFETIPVLTLKKLCLMNLFQKRTVKLEIENLVKSREI